ncbi:heme biosynthesis HemY N-terminal domain-containing protein [Inhella gelatinilytica]|uniref:Heme biosynthesis protein HemY n=1 Tax=Inhella gelatinilytica TaxID=2795030 RepID=A0A931J136_9BURK|nr:heme biosynthesis HemY N-terminal domain-containing protein [Inhella gelatinilytica]MBH9553426.1 heme biosynthesis protein HemY [Inhella gelatinilytica]
MRGVLWLVLLFAGAAVAALVLGRNDGLVSLFWAGWRVDLSLNLFLLIMVVGCVLVFGLLQTLHRLFDLPQRARRWRLAQRDRAAQQLLRESLVDLWSARYARAQKAVQRLLTLNAKTPELQGDGGGLVLAHLMAAEAAHRLQDRARRQEQWETALRLCASHAEARSHEEAARLMAVGWALEDREPLHALRLLAELPAGAARRTQALRQKLQATRMAEQPFEALRTARLLSKHQGFRADVAQSLLRSLAIEVLGTARDAEQLRTVWLKLDSADRRDAFVVARAAQSMASYGAAGEGRQWLRPLFERLEALTEDERAALADALIHTCTGIKADWLPLLERAQARWPREGRLAMALGQVLAELQLWGKARQMLLTAAEDGRLDVAARRRAWIQLADMAKQADDLTAQVEFLERAARAS